MQRDHELILLTQRIDRDEVTDRLSRFYSKEVCQAKKIRIIVGLHNLKYRFGLSDADVVKGLHENVYWMAFCGVKLQAWYVDDGAGRW